MKQYLDLARHIMTNGHACDDRTGTGTVAIFGHQMRFDLADGFPLLTTKKVFTRGIVAELLWMLSGDTNIKTLTDQNVHIWDEWADKNGDLGPVYGEQWRAFGNCDEGTMYPGEDQIRQLVDGLRKSPGGRRHIVTAWDPCSIEDMALPPCHCFFQFDMTGGRVNCQLYQRSADLFIGVPFNIASYAILIHLIAHCLGNQVGDFIHTFGNVHIYNNHLPQMAEQIRRETRPLPKLEIVGERHEYPWQYTKEQIVITGYDPHPVIKGEVSV